MKLLSLVALSFLVSGSAMSQTVVSGSAIIQGNGNSVAISGTRIDNHRAVISSAQNSVVIGPGTSVNSSNGSTVIIQGNTIHREVNRYYHHDRQNRMTIYVDPRTNRFVDIIDTSRNVTCTYDVYQQSIRYCR